MENYKMSFKVLLLGIFFTYSFSWGQDCPKFTYPTNGESNVAVNATITWPEVSGYNGYLLSIGTTPQGRDILNAKPLGVKNFFTPPLGFPDNTQLFVTLSLVPFDGPPIACEEISFTTIDVTTPPPCTMLITPDSEAASVTIITDIEWAYSPSASGYILSMGTQPNGTDILDELDVKNTLSYDPPDDLPQNAMIYVTIVPYNENGVALSCSEEFFTTSIALNTCDPYFDEATGKLIYRAPQITFPSLVGICSDELPYTISTQDDADGFRWYATNSGSEESLLSENRSFGVTKPGRYRFEAYNNIMTENGWVECATTKLFDVVASEPAIIERIEVLNLVDGKKITIFASGSGQYEYALDSPNGPYQDIPIFNSVPEGPHIAYVHDKNGCGITQRNVDRDIIGDDFPAFFTPNGDGINDFWHFVPPPENFEVIINVIFIFDRYGSLIDQINPDDVGWDGTFNNQPMPESDYWFKASFLNRQQMVGHFSLKR